MYIHLYPQVKSSFQHINWPKIHSHSIHVFGQFLFQTLSRLDKKCTENEQIFIYALTQRIPFTKSIFMKHKHD
jgi:hypothetical protein